MAIFDEGGQFLTGFPIDFMVIQALIDPCDMQELRKAVLKHWKASISTSAESSQPTKVFKAKALEGSSRILNITGVHHLPKNRFKPFSGQ